MTMSLLSDPYLAYQDRLRELRQDTLPVMAIRETLGLEDSVGWKRIFGRFDPDGAPYCTLIFETTGGTQKLCLIEVFSSPFKVDESQHACWQNDTLGWFKVTPFPNDPALSTLPRLLAMGESIRVVRYRPRKRCTLISRHGDEPPTFIKVFPDLSGKQVHEESFELFQAALSGRLQFDVAQPLGWDGDMRALWQAAVPGRPVEDALLFGGDLSLPWRMCAALASLGESGLMPKETLDMEGQMERSRRYLGDLRYRLPSRQGEIEHLQHSLTERMRKAETRPLQPIHGSPHVHQWLIDGDRLGLVDFDRLSLGDPELDVATFLAEMDYEDPKRVPVHDINRAFIEGYESAAEPLDPIRLATYRAHKHISKALKASRAVRPDAAARAAANLKRALACLEDTP